MNDVLKTLQRDGILDEATAKRVADACANGTLLEDALREAAPEEKVLKSLAAHFEIPYVELGEVSVPKEFLSKFPARVLLNHHLLPLKEEDGVVQIATNRVFDTSGLDELRLTTRMDFHPVLASTAEIDRAIKRLLGIGADTLQSMAGEDNGLKVVEDENDDMDLENAAEDASIIRFVNQVLAEALDSRATDVHIEPFENQLRVRYRIDGELQEANIPAEVKRYHAAIVSRIKILSHLDIAEKRVPQDGRIRVKVAGREIDLRVSVIPMIHGEAVVLRILDRGDAKFGLEYLGMAARDGRIFEKLLELPHGIILVTGPTGSGKTTTLYTALAHINSVDRKIITVEDPVEYQLRGINQIQVNTKTGLTFASGLRAILRHDPDVVLIGEIRDRETAEIAVQASLTGHLVFSTLHTNDAPGAATRLIDMGVEPYLVSSSLEMVLAQRLVRLICKNCKEETPVADLEGMRAEYGSLVPEKVYRGRGCRACQNTGFRGRQGIFELMPLNEDLRAMIIERKSTGQLRKKAVEQGMRSLREDGWRLVREGKTTIDEVVRNTMEEQLAMKPVEVVAPSVHNSAPEQVSVHG
ncbi:MAG TPA: ATPase, T2SS/T4P/T4SS family [Phycisphaerae bacterium]|nr:ATPase, T2SS/T4P/T4SS family [Phycisphaerae bacterium]